MKNCLLLLLLLGTTVVSAQSKDAKKIAAAIDALHTALVNLDSAALNKLTAKELRFGHSNGKMEDKQTFIHNALNGAFKFTAVAASDETITLEKRTAVVHYVLDAKTINNGTPSDLKLGVLQVWQKKSGRWILLARQAVKL